MKEKMTDSELVELVRNRWEASSRGRNSCKSVQGNITKYIFNEVRVGNGAAKQPALNANLNYVAIENLNSLMSDNPVSISVQHRHPSTELDAKIYQAFIQWVIDRNNMERKRTSNQKNMMLFGTGIFGLRCEKTEDDVFIKIETIDPRSEVVDPLSKDGDVTYRIRVSKYTVTELQKMYPKFVPGAGRASADTSQYMDVDLYNEPEKNGSGEVYTVYEMISKWDGYKNGRYVVCTDDALLEDVEWEYNCGIPEVFIPCVSLSDRTYGLDLMRFITPVCDELNILWKRLAVMIKKCANPQKLVSSLAGIDVDNISNADGQVHEVKNAMDVRGTMAWETPVQITESIYAFIEMLQRLFQMLAGLEDISMGHANIKSTMPSGISLERLMQGVQTRLREMVRNRNDGWRELGEKIAYLGRQYVPAGFMIRITGMAADEISAVWEREKNMAAALTASAGAMTKEEIDRGVNLYLKGKGAKLTRNGNDAFLEIDPSKLEDPSKFDIKVSAGLSVPTNPIDIAAVTKEMHLAGEVDLETYLESINHPRKDTILARSAAWRAFKQFMGMQEQLMKQQANSVGKGGVGPVAPPTLAVPQPSVGEPSVMPPGVPQPQTGGQPLG